MSDDLLAEIDAVALPTDSVPAAAGAGSSNTGDALTAAAEARSAAEARAATAEARAAAAEAELAQLKSTCESRLSSMRSAVAAAEQERAEAVAAAQQKHDDARVAGAGATGRAAELNNELSAELATAKLQVASLSDELRGARSTAEDAEREVRRLRILAGRESTQAAAHCRQSVKELVALHQRLDACVDGMELGGAAQ